MATTLPHSTPNPSGAFFQAGDSGVQERLEPPSPWLYLAGMCVTLSGLFAVNYGIDAPGFTQLTYGLAIAGYTINFLLRLTGKSLRSVQAPILMLIGLGAIYLLTNDSAISMLAPAGAEDDRSKSLQLVFAWMAIAHSFVASSDASVLFSCVPCMTILALVSTHTSDPPVQGAFMVFIAAATFLMVHENYLRTRSARLRQRTLGRDRRLFGGQLQLTALCLVGALSLANLVAVPIRTVGQTLFDANYNGGVEGKLTQVIQNVVKAPVKEQSSVKLATGPQTESEQVVMTVKSARQLNWRGKTFTRYTGHAFTNSDAIHERPLAAEPSGNAPGSDRFQEARNNEADFNQERRTFKIPPGPYELPVGEMQSSSEVGQDVTIQGGSFSQFYGAGMATSLQTLEPLLHIDDAGSMMVSDTLQQSATYHVVSQVPTEDPRLLRAASASLDDVPPSIRQDCLQTAVDGVENPRLKQLAAKITQGLKNNYDRAVAIKEYLSQHCLYNLLALAAPPDRDAVEYFVFDAKEGYCDSFGAAMTLLCRYAGVPTRLASGFLSGDASSDNTYIVKVKHKHIWTEVFFPHYGWVAFDATEGTQDVTNRARARANSMSLIQWFRTHGPLPILTLVLVGVLLVYLVKVEILGRLASRRELNSGAGGRPATNQEIVMSYNDACQLLAKRGLARPLWMTPDEYAVAVGKVVSEQAAQIGPLLAALTRLHNDFRYGAETAEVEEAEEAKRLLEELRKALAEVRRGAFAPIVDPQVAGARWASGGATSFSIRSL